MSLWDFLTEFSKIQLFYITAAVCIGFYIINFLFNRSISRAPHIALLASGLVWIVTKMISGLMGGYHAIYALTFGLICIALMNLLVTAYILLQKSVESDVEESIKNIDMLAAHETGHAMLCAAWPAARSGMVVSIGRAPADRSYARLKTAVTNEALSTPERLLWDMYLCLAGTVAEGVATGRRLDSCSVDLDQWELAARRFLRSGFGGYFYGVPTSEYEARHNASVLGELRDQQKKYLTRFFELNSEILASMSGDLASKRRLDENDMAVYLNGISFTGIGRLPCPA